MDIYEFIMHLVDQLAIIRTITKTWQMLYQKYSQFIAPSLNIFF